MDRTPEPGIRARTLRGTFLLLWLPAVVACFVPFALSLSPAAAVLELSGALMGRSASGLFIVDLQTNVLLLALALGTCSPLVALLWRLALGWRSPDAPASVTTGRIIVALLIAVSAVVVALLIVGLLQGDGSMVAPILGALVGAATLLVLRLPRWRRLTATTRLIGAMNAGYVACTLASLATFARSPTPGWWLLAWGALVATAEIGLLPREEG